MDVQGGLIQKGLVNDDSQILKPTAEGEARLHRDKSTSGNGTYYGKLQDGTEEPIGGPGFAGGFRIESGTFSRTAISGSGTQNVVTVGRAKVIFFYANAGGSRGSQGQDDGSKASCLSLAPLGGDQVDLSNSISFNLTGDGYLGKVSAINANSFDVNWTVQGNGLDVDVNWYAITV